MVLAITHRERLIRGVDVALALLALILLSPLLLIVSLILRFTGEKKVLYLQERVGRGAEPFYIVKFATMLADSPNLEGGLLTQRGDPRVLPFGRLLRATKINELPQLLNIVKGDIAIVGPRPIAFEHFALYPQEHKRVYHLQRPGLTGIGSVFFRNEESVMAECGIDPQVFYAKVIMPYKAALENWYLTHKTVRLNILVLWWTILVVLGRSPSLPKWTNLPEPPEQLRPLVSKTVL